MKILELTNFSAGICGVWQRVKQESELLARKGHEVLVISSNAVKGSNELASNTDKVNGFKIIRKPFKKFGGESFMSWNFEKEAMNFKPDIIIVHSYRHLHTTKALKIVDKLGKQGKRSKVFLVTHAPFERERGFLQNLIVWLYDFFIGSYTINKFDRIIAITKWEIPHLLNLGVKKEKVVYIPNGIPKEFFIQKKEREEHKILFFGRVSSIKNLETLIKAVDLINDNKISLEIVGLREEEYYNKLKKLVSELNLDNRIIFSPAIYNTKEKIKKIDSCKIFVLPSISEGMPQSLVEAMARQKIVITSNNKGNSDIIQNGKNGYLFETKNEERLAEIIDYCLDNKNKKDLEKVKKEAKRLVLKFQWSKLINDLEKLF